MTLQDRIGATEAPGTGLFARLDFKWVVIGAVIFIVAWLALVPLGFLVWQSFSTPATAAVPAVATLKNYLDAYTASDIGPLFWNSVVFATGTSCLALTIGTLFAWLNERTNTPFKMLFYAASIVPLVSASAILPPLAHGGGCSAAGSSEDVAGHC